MNLTEQESIFCQALAMTSLPGELSNKDFLNSDYYNENITFIGNNDNLKKILRASGLTCHQSRHYREAGQRRICKA